MTDLFWTEERIAKAEKLWNEGLSARAIAEIVGSKKNTVINMAFRHRERFPARQASRHPMGYADAAPHKRAFHPDRVTRVTFSGASVTMPRVPTIDGPAPIMLQIPVGEEITQ
ncbi:GcrA family cell cycle regulator protein [Rhizobium sp. TAL182]|uniref:GcrA family cell cycle regulator n=1 Tax=Rhizobium sp. TAL182 TaxID=2020313 RepID=UPI000A2117A4|nr:GcrA family cell cycle regulator [Rhizobium sp. TAL182]ARO24768.1 GcrA family cell cycle regulator protein [Rhizobium sp. TAL182]